MYPAQKAHLPYFHLWPLRLYNIFPHYLINGMIFEKKKILNKTCVISNFRRVLNIVCFLLGNPQAPEFYMPTFQNTLSVPPAYEDGTAFRNVGI